MSDERTSGADRSGAGVGSRLGRRRLLQALGGVAGFATLGSPVTGSGGRVRAQTSGDGPWAQRGKLTATDGDAGDLLGASVAVDDGTILVGAFSDVDGQSADEQAADDVGSAYVFTRSGEEWTQQAKLTASDGDPGDRFGTSVAVDRDTAVIGANFDEDPNGEDAGSAYVFTRSEGEWTQQAKLTASDGETNDNFGVSVAVDKDTAVVGAEFDANPNAGDAGSAYVFGIEAPRPAVRPILGATVKQPGSPDGQARVQYGISAVVEEPTLVLEFTNVRSELELSVNADDSDTAGIFRSGNRQVQFPDPCKETTATIAFDIAGEASAEEQFDIDARLLDETGTATSSATVTVGGGGEGSTTAAVELTAVPDGLQQYNITLSGPSDTSITEVQSNALSGNFFQVTDGGPGSSSVTARAVDLDDTIQPGAGQQCLFTVTYDQSVPLSTLSVTVNELLDDDGNPISAGQVSLTDDSTPFPNGLPGTGSQPADPDNDGVFEDVDGDGEADFDDAIETAFVQSDQLNSEQVAALDFDGDGDFDFDDAIELAFQTSG